MACYESHQLRNAGLQELRSMPSAIVPALWIILLSELRMIQTLLAFRKDLEDLFEMGSYGN